MSGIVVDPLILATLRMSLALLLGTTALHKWRDTSSFSQSIRNYQLLPARMSDFAAVLLASSETLLAIALLIPRSGTLAAWSTAGLLSLYAAAMAINLVRGRNHIDCGCSGPSQRQPLSRVLLTRNFILVLTALLAASPAGSRPLMWLDGITLIASVLALSALYVAVETMLARPSPWQHDHTGELANA